MRAMMVKSFRGRKKGVGIDGPVLAASLSLNILSLVVPITILLIFDRVIPFQSFETLTLLALALLVSAVLELALRWARSVVLNAAAEHAATGNHRTFVQRVLRAEIAAFAKESPAVHLEKHAALGRLRDYHSGQNQVMIIDLPFTAIFIAMVGLIGGWLVLVPLATLTCVMTFALVMKHLQRSIFDTRQSLDSRRYSFLAEVLGHMPTIKANTMERQMTRRFEMLQKQTVKVSQKLILFAGFAQSCGAIFTQLSVAAMGLLGAFFVIQNVIGIAELAACMLLNGRIIQPLMKLMSFWVQSENVAASRAQLAKLDQLPRQAIPKSQPSALPGLITVTNATIADPNGSDPFFQDESFVVDAGNTALIEAVDTQAVKLFFDAICGHGALQHGRVYIDGYLPQDRIGHRGTSGIVLLEQIPAIFSATLLENLSAFGDAEQVERAKHFAQRLGLERRINRLPLGYNTMMNKGGVFEQDPVNRQLIALIRAFAIQPRILLMIEPTAILDTTERDLLSACLAELDHKPTILVASPDPRMRRIADQVITLTPSISTDMDMWVEDARLEEFEASLQSKEVA